MVFGSLVELHAWLHSCLCFSPLEKLFLKSWLDTSSIASYLSSFLSFFLSQSRQHLNTFTTSGYLSSFQAFSYRNLDTSSTPGGSIEKVSIPSIASRHLVDRSSLISCVWCFVPRHFLDTYICRWLNPRHLTRHSLDTFICQPLLRFYIFSLCDPNLISLDLSLNSSISSLPNTLISLPIFSLRFLQAFSRVSSLGKLIISHSSCISCFET